MLFFPEIFIANMLNTFQDELRESINENVGNNLITQMFGGSENFSIGEVNYLKEALNLFSKKRPIDVKFGINIDTVKFPSAQIYLPSENQVIESLGIDPEYEVVPESTVDPDNSPLHKRVEKNTIFMKSNYNIVIISTNADQVLIIYQVFKWMLLRYKQIFEINNFNNMKISGADLKMEQNVIPQTIFMRSLILEFDYEYTAINKNIDYVGSSLIPDKLKIDMKIEL